MLLRYVFPCEPVEGIIDLTSEDRAFYFNPYSGELSLTFPKAERKCRGGILAYVVSFVVEDVGSSSSTLETVMCCVLIMCIHI